MLLLKILWCVGVAFATLNLINAISDSRCSTDPTVDPTVDPTEHTVDPTVEPTELEFYFK